MKGINIINNIPEGIVVSLSERASRSFDNLGDFFPFITPTLLSALLGVVGGVMVYTSLDKLLPASRSLGKEHHSILGIMSGMIIIVLSLVLF